MGQSPRRRVLTDIGSDQMKSKLLTSKATEQRMSRINKVFKLTPVHTHQIQTNKYQLPQNITSRINEPVSCLDELNTMFQLRKISNEPIFSRLKYKSIDQIRSKSRINRDIENSIQYIQNIKNNHNILATSKAVCRTHTENKNKKTDILSALGLSFDHIDSVKSKERYSTQPNTSKPNSIQHLNKSKKHNQVGLYSYLERDFVQKKQLHLNEGKMIDYANNPNNENFHRIILQKSRRFLKKSAVNKFREINKINLLIQEESKKFIQQQLKMKRQKYAREYRIRNNVPYFSYLSLSERQKQAVLNSVHRKRSIT